METLFRMLSALLSYPESDLVASLPEIGKRLACFPSSHTLLHPLLAHLAGHDLITLQETYVTTFDRTPSQALHLFEHIHGESRDRGQAMVDLLTEYQRHGFEPSVAELPDHVPLFLEFLSVIDPLEAGKLLGDAIHVLAAIGDRLERHASPYAAAFHVLRTLTDVVPQAQQEPPQQDMEEALATFGPGADGVEPLLKPTTAGVQPLHFHPRVHPVASSRLA